MGSVRACARGAGREARRRGDRSGSVPGPHAEPALQRARGRCAVARSGAGPDRRHAARRAGLAVPDDHGTQAQRAAAAFLAFEDVSPESGPSVYYPGSHRLPYVFAEDVGISAAEFGERGYSPYHERYEPRIAALIEEAGLQPRYFTPRKGDVLVWHANMIHGGSLRAQPAISRRALVCHYFAGGCVTYHDLAANPSYLQAH